MEIYDYRTDIRNVVITPEIRSRFMRIEPGTITGSHTHDLGHEVFIVMNGRIEFNIDGELATLGPGQMCFARVDQPHTLRCIGDQAATIYLSVTPHLEPTHTWWDESGSKAPFRYGGASAKERAADTGPKPTIDELADQHVAAAEVLAEAAAKSARVQAECVASLKPALASGDKAAAKAAVDAMWGEIFSTYKKLQAMEIIWNDLSPRATE
jgi:quercetin dioxygenase-like cupin family protein